MALYEGRFQFFAFTAAEWAAANPVLMLGEFGAQDVGSSFPILKVGDGVRPWSMLPILGGAGGGGGTTDHGLLLGLDDDDHPQYYNAARGDARWALLSHTHAAGEIVSGTFNDAQIAASSVTQHQGALSIAWGQITGAPTMPASANPSALVGLAAVNGVASTFMRSDAAPALNQAIAPTWSGAHTFSASVRFDSTLNLAGSTGTSGQVLTSQGSSAPIWATPASAPTGANPSASVGLAAVNGAATTFMRSDAAPALSQAIAPTWTADHAFAANLYARGWSRFTGWSGAPASDAHGPGVEIGYATGSGAVIAYNRTGSAYAPITIGGSIVSLDTGGTSRMTINAAGVVGITNAFSNGANTIQLGYNGQAHATTYGSVWVNGGTNGFYGYVIFDNLLNPAFMSNGTTGVGIFVHGEGKWVITRESSTLVTCGYTFHAPAFNTPSSRDSKRVTTCVSNITDRLRALADCVTRYVANGDEHEQVGAVAEDVAGLFPELSRDGRSIAYDRLAWLMLRDLRERGIY